MKNREDAKYVVKVFEAQWDTLHSESVKPFFEQLKRETIDEGHDALYSYYVFQGPSSLMDALNHHKNDPGIEGRFKVGYISAHGEKDRIQALHDISRVKLRNLLYQTTSFAGFFFGACDFVNRKTAEFFLNSIPSIKWIAGYEKWCPFLEGTFCDILFFKLLMSGQFQRSKRNARWKQFSKPEEVVMALYEVFPLSKDMRFSLFYRSTSGEILSTLEQERIKNDLQ